MKDNGVLQYFLTDHLGSVVATLSDTGTLISQQRYLPFGAPRTDINGPYASPTDFGYTGQRKLDSGMGGIMDYKARFYSPALGRFIQPDTLIPDVANPQSWNRYSYTLNNPIRLNDPSGHWPCDGFMSCVAVGASIISATAKYIQENPINISKRLTTNIPIVIPSGIGMQPGIINKAVDLKVGIRFAGRTIGDDLFAPALAVGFVATVAPNQIENYNQGATWNDVVGDLLVDGAGFVTSEMAGDVAAGGLSWTGPAGALAGNFGGDIGWGLLWEKNMEKGGNRQKFIDWLGELPEEVKKTKNLFPKPVLPDPVHESPHPWQQITPIRTPRPSGMQYYR